MVESMVTTGRTANRPAASTGRVPPWTLAFGAILSVQIGSALSVGLIQEIGAAGTAWLRLSVGALVFLAIARPPLRSVRRQHVVPLMGLGITTGLMSTAFLAAIELIPLGTAVAIEFLGPLTVAAVRSRTTSSLACLGVALTGVILLTEPWHGEIDPAGIGFAVLAAISWGTYVVLTQHVGDKFTGTGALSLTVPIAAATVAIIGIPEAAGHLTWHVLVTSVGLALLLPVIPVTLEMLSLRQMTATSFGTLMALGPAVGLMIGLIVLGQTPSPLQGIGVIIVVAAGIAAQRDNHQPSAPTPTAPAPAPARSPLRGRVGIFNFRR